MTHPPQDLLEDGKLYLAYVGMETDLIFTQGIDLPGFASFPLLETEDGRNRIAGYYQTLIDLGRQSGRGVILESPTWVANRDRAAPLGYDPDRLDKLNQAAIDQMVTVRSDNPNTPILISGNVGPRDDAYAPGDQMTAEEAKDYHLAQMTALAKTANVDVVSGYTLAYPAEAIGIVEAAKQVGLPVVISFTVETNGKLPTGATMAEAIAQVDDATDGYAAYFMINCAHPDHFDSTLQDAPWMQRIKGIVANASRCSHAELDEAEELDDGNPAELGQQMAALKARFPHLQVLGGCCGTDMRHLSEIAQQAGRIN